MFGLGMSEMVVIAIVALLFIGPDKLPDAAKKLSKGIRDFRNQTRDLQQQIDDETNLGGAMRDLKSALRGEDLHRPYVPPHLQSSKDNGDSGAVEDPQLGSGDGEHGDGERGDDADGHSGTSDDAAESGLPVLKPAAGAIAQGADEDTDSATDSASSSATADERLGDESHG